LRYENNLSRLCDVGWAGYIKGCEGLTDRDNEMTSEGVADSEQVCVRLRVDCEVWQGPLLLLTPRRWIYKTRAICENSAACIGIQACGFNSAWEAIGLLIIGRENRSYTKRS
jgi:hypothetical protein